MQFAHQRIYHGLELAQVPALAHLRTHQKNQCNMNKPFIPRPFPPLPLGFSVLLRANKGSRVVPPHRSNHSFFCGSERTNVEDARREKRRGEKRRGGLISPFACAACTACDLTGACYVGQANQHTLITDKSTLEIGIFYHNFYQPCDYNSAIVDSSK